jgi:class 3 adenylate cyclase/tetratricopeptide (TPR) repeat protein
MAQQGRAAPAEDLLDSFVSPLLLRRLAEERSIEPPEARTLVAALAAIDVKGFSPLAESMSRRGPAGIEDLASLISTCFGTLVDVVRDYGGAAHTFPGDAVIAVWPTTSAFDLTEATRLAAGCARELAVAGGRAQGTLPLKAGVAAGVTSLAHVGGFADRWELLVTGKAMGQLADATHHARRGEVVMSKPAWALICEEASAEERDGRFVLESLSGGSRVLPPRPSPIAPERRPLLRSYLPDGLLAQLDSGQSDWLAEFRRLSVLFILLSPRRKGPAFDPDLLHRSFQKIQRALYRYEGGVVQICHDDKGVVVLGAMGLPGVTHEDDADRAVLAALDTHRELDALDIDCRIGIATGPTFCGALGNRSRREYSVVGSVVNLAARLMEDREEGVLCDEATRAAVGADIGFEGPLHLDLKGFPDAVSAFRAAASQTPRVRGRPPRMRRSAAAATASMIGRDADRARMVDWLGGLRRGGEGILVIRGEAGVGKSLLGTEFVRRARDAGIEVMLGFCDTLNATVAYHPWRPILEQVLQLRGVEDPAERRARAVAQVDALMGSPELAPLLGAALALGIPESSVTGGMAGAVRRDNTRDLLATLVRAAARQHGDRDGALVIAIEDAHWMDAASWALVDRMRRSAGELPLGIALTLRPMPDQEVAEACLRAEETTVLDLDVLSEDGTQELVRQRLGAEEVERDLAELIFRQSQGNPFFCEEVVTAMQETGRIRVERGVARLVWREPASGDSVVPDSISGVVESRIDRLSAELQLTLKAASVIGQRVDPEILCAIHPVESRLELIERQIEDLTKLDLLRVDPRGRHFFKHAITRDVAYNHLLFSQRRQLHRTMAEHLEASGGGVASEVLFRHWRESGEVAKALDYVDATGAEAMRQGHYPHAIELFEYGLGSCTDGEADAGEEIPRRVRWSHHLGAAQVAIGRHSVGRHSLEVGLQGLRHPVPSGTAPVAAAIARELGRQAVHRILSRRAIRARRTSERRLVTASEGYEQLGYIHYASGETLLGIHAALKMLNLSERAAVSSVLARSYAAMALTVSVIPLRRLATLYENAARRAAESLGDPLTRAYVDWISGIRAAGEARWDRVESGAGGALEPAARLADWRLQMMSLQTLASGAVLQGDLARALELSERQLEIAKEQGNRLWEAWALNSLSEARRGEGDEESALGRCQRALDILEEESDRTEEIRANGMRATALLRLGRTDEALMTARRTADLIASTDLTAFNTYEGFTGVCEVMLTLAEETLARGAVMPPSLRRDAKRAWKAFKGFARVFPIGRPRCGVVGARLLRLQGRRAAAVAALERAVADATLLAMPHEEALALLWLGRCEWLPAARRRDALDSALELLGTGVEHHEAQQLRAELPQ